MSTLVIHAPKGKVDAEDKRSFESTMLSGIGDEYAINRSLVSRLSAGCRVILLSKDERRQAVGVLVRLEPRSKAGNGIQRYDVLVKDLKLVEYQGETIRLNHCGVAVLDR